MWRGGYLAPGAQPGSSYTEARGGEAGGEQAVEEVYLAEKTLAKCVEMRILAGHFTGVGASEMRVGIPYCPQCTPTRWGLIFLTYE